jgi:vitamin B12 transporter
MKKFLSRVVLCLWSSSALSPLFAQSLTPVSTTSASVPTIVVSTTVPTVVVPVTPVPTVKPKAQASKEEPATMPEVVVTANRVDVDAKDITVSETVLNSEELESKQAGTVKDALSQIPGVEVAQNGGPGQTSSVFIRGNDPENTLILYDGIPLNDPIGAPYGYPYLDGLTLDGVNQLEVLRGPQSTLWGSNAIGGVINIVPKSGPQPLGGSVLMEGGSYGTSREAVSAQGGDKGGYFNFDASHFNTAGFPALDVKGLDQADAAALAGSQDTHPGGINNGDDNNTASLRLGSSLTSNLEEKVLTRYSQTNTSLDNFNNGNVLADNPAYFALQQQFMVDSSTNWKLLNGDWEQQLNIAFFDDDRTYTATANPYNSTSSKSNFDGQTAQAGWQNNIHFAKEETLVLGIQGQEQWGNTTSSSDTVPVTMVQTGSGYAESQTNIDDRLFFNLGGRWEAQSQYGTHTTYQAGLAYLVPEVETKLKANYGTAYLAPNLYQLYDPTYGSVPNGVNLVPETSLGFDFGFEQPIGGKNFINIGATYFDSDVTNLISYDPNTFVSINIGKAWIYGVESFLEFKGIQNLTVKGNYTYTYAWNQSSYVALVRRPQHKAGLDADYQLGAASFGGSLSYTGSSFDQDFQYPANTVILPTYFLLNLRADYQVSDKVKFFARVDNLFNQWYEEAYGYSTPGLSVYGGTKVSF